MSPTWTLLFLLRKKYSGYNRKLLFIFIGGFIMRDDTLGTYKDAETVIYDGQGQAHDGYYCDSCCVGCPYAVSDLEGEAACYGDEYHRCMTLAEVLDEYLSRCKNEN
jgi:hypothetical protein